MLSGGSCSVSFVFTVFRPQHDAIARGDKMANKFDNILSAQAYSHYGDFNIRHKERLVYSNRTDEERKCCNVFPMAFDLT